MYHDDSTPSTGTLIDSDNPIEFGDIGAGLTSDVQKIHIWNDRGGLDGSDTAESPRLFVLAQPDSIATFLDGTALNEYTSMIEARSCGAYNVAADAQTAWTPISQESGLLMGDMPSTGRREVELRIRVPSDSASTILKHFKFRVAYDA
jgi:hypothetical protein